MASPTPGPGNGLPPATRPLRLAADTESVVDVARITTPLTRDGARVKSHQPWTALRVIRWLGLGVLVAVAGYGVWVWAAFENFRREIYTPLIASPTPDPAWALGTATALSYAGVTATPTTDPYANLPAGRINILVLGSDKRPEHLGLSPRSDTLILVNLDTQTRVVRMLTIPRDLAVEIPGYRGLQKINAAYFLGEQERGPGGGQSLAVETVSELLDVPIDYYVMINFQGFLTLVDTLGGVDVDVPAELDDWHYPSENPDDPFAEIHVHFDEGWQHMDGIEALRYARTRHADNDFMRSKRQLQIIMAMKQKATSLDIITKIPGVLDQLAGMIETNIPSEQQLSLIQAGYDLDPSHILTTTIGADLITPIRLPDRSEGLSLNWKKAKPIIDQFFGRGPTATPTKPPRRTPTPSRRNVATMTPTPGKQPKVSVTPRKVPTVTIVRPQATVTPRTR
jgi:LCP family protein required for cell wall assembly